MTSAAADNLAGARADLLARVRRKKAALGRRTFPSPEFWDDPVGFAREILEFDPWDKQARWMAAVAPEDAAVSVTSGHKTGKSAGAAGVALWHWGTRRRARVVLMAPKIEHVEVVLWPEIRRFYLSAGRCGACKAKIENDPAHPPKPCEFCSPLGDPDWIGVDPTKGLRAPDGREIFAYTARKADAIGGISGPEMFFIFDEASGIDNAVFESMKGNESGGARKLLLGNPLRTIGEFYDSHHRGRKFYTYTARISSEDTPNAKSGEKLIPGLATRDTIEKRAEEWGRDSVLYAIRIKGEFPKYEEGQLVPVDVLEAAERRWDPSRAVGRLCIGVDVAFSGDDAAIAPRRGDVILEVTSYPQVGDEDALAERVMDTVRVHGRDKERPLVIYDANGNGAKLGRALRKYEAQIEAIGINGTAKPRKPREYFQLRDEVICNFAAWLRAVGAIPTDLKLEGEISATKVKDAGAGRRRVLSNEEIKKLLGRSPDRRNACELAVWDPASTRADSPEEEPPAQEPAKRRASADADLDDVVIRGRGGAFDPYADGGFDPYGGGFG